MKLWSWEAQQRSSDFSSSPGSSHWLVLILWRPVSFSWIIQSLLICVWWHYWIGLLVSWQWRLEWPQGTTSKQVHSFLFLLSFLPMSLWLVDDHLGIIKIAKTIDQLGPYRMAYLLILSFATRRTWRHYINESDWARHRKLILALSFCVKIKD